MQNNRGRIPEIAKARFNSALSRYRRAKARSAQDLGGDQREAAIKRIDIALDILLESQSPGFAGFHKKIAILESEYGVEAQPRHMAAIYADVASLAAIAATIPRRRLRPGR